MTHAAYSQPIIPPDSRVSAATVAERYGVSTRQVMRWAAAGRLKPIRIGKRCIRFLWGDVVSSLDGGAQQAGAA